MGQPVGYFITFTTYGTWLRGDERCSITKENNRHGTAFNRPDINLYKKEKASLKNPAVILDSYQREAVLKAILEVCKFRDWTAHAVHVRSNHVHVVVSGDNKPYKMMIDFKAYATRAIKKLNTAENKICKYWTQHGSTKYLWTKEYLDSAIKYVKYGQGKTMSLGAIE